jgi:NADPH:quinone reductase-like Zn-dependent oxidoreductase
MRNVAICGRATPALAGPADHIESVAIEGVNVHCGLIHTPDTVFDPRAPENAGHVLIRVTAFSCNYRDKGVALLVALKGEDRGFMAVGSELVGHIVAVGRDVAGLVPGDRVIADSAYPSEAPGVPPGLTTNHASRERLVVHAAKVAKVPPEMPDEVAAAFTVGAQTVYGMLRRLALRPGANVLVTAACSNTSLFAISALARRGAKVVATTTRARRADELRHLGVSELVEIADERGHERLIAIARTLGGFDAVIDPYSDVHFQRLSKLLANGGRYVTCGIADQSGALLGRAPQPPWDPRRLLAGLIAGNVELIGNCLGSSADLAAALEDWRRGRLEVIVDSRFTGRAVGAFLHRTFEDRERFGKVVYRYSDGG